MKKSDIKVICNTPCPKETVKQFNRRIAEVIAMKHPKHIIDKIIKEAERL